MYMYIYMYIHLYIYIYAHIYLRVKFINFLKIRLILNALYRF